ncbi:MAG: AMP-binding protein, partial [Acidobacteria bacterium]|nr:AMP-binding protein [Acidobacteriota bacterium]
ALTAERFVPLPVSLPGSVAGARAYRTGDRARWLADGSLDFAGRLDDQVKVRGFRVEPAEIEAALEEHPALSAVVVLVAGSAADDKRLVAYAVPETGAAVTSAEVLAFARERLPAYLVPGAVVLLDELPRTANDKIDRRALAELEPWSGGTASRTPAAGLETRIAELWSEVLDLPEVGAEDDFFELGGHSLLATRLVSRIHEELGVELPLRLLFAEPTVAGLAREVGGLPDLEGERLEPRATLAPPPLSFAQQRLWFLHRYDPSSPAYGLPVALRLAGTLRGRALASALTEVARRHEVLRTVFPLVGEEPVQRVLPPGPVLPPRVDLTRLEQPVREEVGAGLLRGLVRRPFDLLRRPGWRTLLVRLAGGATPEHALVIHQHHIVSDGWSLGLLLRELAVLYNSRVAPEVGGPLPEAPPEPAIQYGDFALWQRRRLSGELAAEQLDYWRRQLEAVPVLELPLDRPRPAVRSTAGAEVPIHLGPELTRAAEALARSRRTTLFNMLTACYAALLARWSGQSEVALGTPVSGRSRTELEGLLGLFVDTLVLRADVGGSPSLVELAARLHGVSQAAFEHQDLPFERLVEALQPERDLAHTPLFQAMVILQNAVAASGGAAAR